MASSHADPDFECWKAVDESTGNILGYIALSRKRADAAAKQLAVGPANYGTLKGQSEAGQRNVGAPPGTVPEVLAAGFRISEEADLHFDHLDGYGTAPWPSSLAPLP